MVSLNEQTQEWSGGVLLASRSPRRRALLREHGVEHESLHPGFEDGVLEPTQVPPEQWVAALAYLKASAGASRPEALGRLVIGADTTCVREGKMLGTPRDVREAEAILRGLMGGEHRVLTGVALVVRTERGERRRVFVDSARVRLGVLEEGVLRTYLLSGGWEGKAGAYNLAERLEAGWPLEYEGDPTTIMGLPMRRLVRELGRWRNGLNEPSATAEM